MNNIETLYQLGKKVGLNKNEVNNILNKTNSKVEQPSFSVGPDYSGGWYGTTSIKDF